MPSQSLPASRQWLVFALHDNGFDHYLLSLTDDYRIVFSRALETTKDTCLRDLFHPIVDKTIELPERFLPEVAFLQRHRERMFATNA